MHLHNYIPITREDTRRGSTATTLRRAAERTKAEIYAAQKKWGRNGYGAWQRTKKGGRSIHRSYKKENR